SAGPLATAEIAGAGDVALVDARWWSERIDESGCGRRERREAGAEARIVDGEGASGGVLKTDTQWREADCRFCLRSRDLRPVGGDADRRGRPIRLRNRLGAVFDRPALGKDAHPKEVAGERGHLDRGAVDPVANAVFCDAGELRVAQRLEVRGR